MQQQRLRRTFVYAAQDQEARLDKWLHLKCPELSRRHLRDVIAAGSVFVNRHRCKIASRALIEGDRVEVDLTVSTLGSDFEAEQERLCDQLKIHQDHPGFMVIEKPFGLHSQGTQLGDRWTVLAAAARKLGCTQRDLYLVHRLDQAVSGLMVIAKQPEWAAKLSKQLRTKELQRGYWALVEGAFQGVRRIETPITSTAGYKQHAVSFASGTPLQEHVGFSLVQLLLGTGRTHQIRIHMASIGHPIYGDARYGKAQCPQAMALHSSWMKMTTEQAAFTSTPPLDHPAWGLEQSEEVSALMQRASWESLLELFLS